MTLRGRDFSSVAATGSRICVGRYRRDYANFLIVDRLSVIGRGKRALSEGSEGKLGPEGG